MRAEEPLAALVDEVLVEYHQFGLCDEEADDSSQSVGVPDEGIRIGPGTASFLSDGSDHYPMVRFESWSHEPSAPPPPWDVEEGMDEVIDLPSGVIRLWEVTGGPSPNAFHVGRPGTYRLRVHVRSFMTAVMNGEVDQDEMFGHGAEQWLLRLWPAK